MIFGSNQLTKKILVRNIFKITLIFKNKKQFKLFQSNEFIGKGLRKETGNFKDRFFLNSFSNIRLTKKT